MAAVRAAAEYGAEGFACPANQVDRGHAVRVAADPKERSLPEAEDASVAPNEREAQGEQPIEDPLRQLQSLELWDHPGKQRYGDNHDDAGRFARDAAEGPSQELATTLPWFGVPAHSCRPHRPDSPVGMNLSNTMAVISNAP